MNEQRLSRLVQEAFELHAAGETKEAEEVLLAELKHNDLPKLRTAIAQLRLTSGNPAGVLELIDPLLDEEDFLVNIMATRAYLELGKSDDAAMRLDILVKLVHRIIQTKRGNLQGEQREYPGIVLNFAGSLGQHRRVLDLYKQWSLSRADWVARYYAAVACFNLGRFKQAATHWSAIGEIPHALGMQFVAVLAERGTVPPFGLEYILPDPQLIGDMLEVASEDIDENGLQMGLLRMALLEMALDTTEGEDFAEEALTPLIVGGGDWGAALGVGLLESSVVSKQVKLIAVKLLVQTGFFPEGTPIPVMLDGEMTSVVIHRQEVPPPEIVTESMVHDIVYRLEEHLREEVEQKTLPVTATLARGLKNMPAAWLEAACRLVGLQPKRLRKQRERQLVSFLSTEVGLFQVVESLSADEKELLGYLLDKGGWARMGSITAKFGSMEGDGFYWLEREPEGVLARLWCRGLVMVGSAKLNKRRTRFAMVPVDLQEQIEQLLNGFVPAGVAVEQEQDNAVVEAAAAVTGEEAMPQVYQFRVELEGTHPLVWRRIQLPESATFWDLHVAIHDAFGWEDRHLHMFYGASTEHNRQVKIGIPEDLLFSQTSDVRPGWEEMVATYFVRVGKKMDYLYDFADNWQHQITLEAKVAAADNVSYPRCSGGEEMCPPEDCGGIYGYRKMLGKGEIKPGEFDWRTVSFSDAAARLQKLFANS